MRHNPSTCLTCSMQFSTRREEEDETVKPEIPTPEQVAYAIDLAPNAAYGRLVCEIVPADARWAIAKAIAADRERIRRAAALPGEPTITVDAVHQKLAAIMARLDLATYHLSAALRDRTPVVDAGLVQQAEDHAIGARVAARMLADLCREAAKAAGGR